MNAIGIAVMIIFIFIISPTGSRGEYTKIVLKQGTLVGLKVFPETSKTAVYAFLGIPYAQPPIADLRFALPRPDNGWNQTLFANNMKSICPQLSNTFYEETPNKGVLRDSQTTENCLYLNIWTPEAGIRYGNLAVVAVLTGEDMSFDWQQNRPTGLDLASEGIVIVHIQYRTNIFGWLGQGTAEFPGNFGLADQELAFKWIQENINNFGGNPRQVTLLAHGTTGVTCGILHLINPSTNDLFSKLILMSGTPFTPQMSTDHELTESLIVKLGCEAEKPIQILKCLRSKSLRDLEKSFETVYRSGNFSKILGPVLQQRFSSQIQSSNLWSILKSGEFRKIPIMFGLCSNEGAFMRDYWIDLAREGFDHLRSYINFTILPQILHKYHLANAGDTDQILKAINWKYFQLFKPDNPIYLLNSMQRFISEAEFEAPFFETIETLARSFLVSNASSQLPELYVYSFQTSSQSMDMRGKINLFGGTGHSADLPLLMGPSLFQQIARRRLTPTEDKLCRRMRQLFTDFIKNGNPTPSRIYDAWLPYTTTKKYIKILGEFVQNLNEYPVSHIESNIHDIEELLFNAAQSGTEDSRINREPQNPYEIRSTSGEIRRKNSYIVNRQDYEYYNHLKTVHSFWYGLLPTIYHNLQANETADREGRETVVLAELGECNKYKYAFFWMLGLVCFLLGTLGICVYVLRRDHPGWTTHL